MYDSGYSSEERERIERMRRAERERAAAEIEVLRQKLAGHRSVWVDDAGFAAEQRAREKQQRDEEKQLRRTLRTPGGVEAYLNGKPPPTPEEIAARKEQAAFSRAYGPAGKMGSRKDLFRDSLMRGRRR